MMNSSALNSILAPWLMIRCVWVGVGHVLVGSDRLFRECLPLSRTAEVLQIAIHNRAQFLDGCRGPREPCQLVLCQPKPHDFLEGAAPQLHRHANEHAVQSVIPSA